MSSFEKHSFNSEKKHALIGSFIEESSLRNDTNVEIMFGQLDAGFYAAPHIHTKTKTVVIVLKGGMVFAINKERVEVLAGEYIVFDKGVTEEVVSVLPDTENLTIHTPSVPGGDKQELS